LDIRSWFRLPPPRTLKMRTGGMKTNVQVLGHEFSCRQHASPIEAAVLQTFASKISSSAFPSRQSRLTEKSSQKTLLTLHPEWWRNYAPRERFATTVCTNVENNRESGTAAVPLRHRRNARQSDG